MAGSKKLQKDAALDKARSAAAKAEATRLAADLAARKKALALIRKAYVPIFGLPIDVAGLDFRATPKAFLTELLSRQAARLPGLPDSEFITVWLRFARSQVAIRPAERTRRDREFLDALTAEWERRKLSVDGDEAYFRWPSTLVSELTGTAQVDGGWPSAGMLDAFGYHVGKTKGLGSAARRQILRFLFEERLPLVFDTTYTEAWGQPTTARRLQKLAETLSALVRNAKRNSSRDYTKAISEWEDDLSFLWSTYYVGHFHFGWPTA
jgi:hypothetical protein